jgi:hypothetical protein
MVMGVNVPTEPAQTVPGPVLIAPGDLTAILRVSWTSVLRPRSAGPRRCRLACASRQLMSGIFPSGRRKAPHRPARSKRAHLWREQVDAHRRRSVWQPFAGELKIFGGDAGTRRAFASGPILAPAPGLIANVSSTGLGG